MNFFQKVGAFFSGLFDKLISIGGVVLARGVFIVTLVGAVFYFYYTIKLVIDVLNGSMHGFYQAVISTLLVGVMVFALVMLIPYAKSLMETLNAL